MSQGPKIEPGPQNESKFVDQAKHGLHGNIRCLVPKMRDGRASGGRWRAGGGWADWRGRRVGGPGPDASTLLPLSTYAVGAYTAVSIWFCCLDRGMESTTEWFVIFPKMFQNGFWP